MTANIPDNLRYTKEHEWARAENGVVRVGVTAHAVEQLGDVTLVDLPVVGAEVKAGDRFGDIESVKTVSELFAPVGGEVVEINDGLESKPEAVNEAPYDGDGWSRSRWPMPPNSKHSWMRRPTPATSPPSNSLARLATLPTPSSYPCATSPIPTKKSVRCCRESA